MRFVIGPAANELHVYLKDGTDITGEMPITELTFRMSVNNVPKMYLCLELFGSDSHRIEVLEEDMIVQLKRYGIVNIKTEED